MEYMKRAITSVVTICAHMLFRRLFPAGLRPRSERFLAGQNRPTPDLFGRCVLASGKNPRETSDTYSEELSRSIFFDGKASHAVKTARMRHKFGLLDVAAVKSERTTRMKCTTFGRIQRGR